MEVEAHLGKNRKDLSFSCMIEPALSPDFDDLSAMAYPHFQSQFGDTTYTKVFVGGLAWETPTEEMRAYFEQFGEILEAVIITDRNTGKSKGYGFVTFRDPESARRACSNPNPVIDGRRANCNIASLGRPRPSPPRGMTQGSNPYQTNAVQGASSYGGIRAGVPPPPPPPPAVMYAPYGYPTYAHDYSYHQALYNTQVQQPQYFHRLYGASSSSPMGSPCYYGYSLQAPPRGTFSTPSQTHRLAPPPYLYYPPHLEGSFSTYPPTLQQQPTLLLPSSDSQHNPSDMEAGVVSSKSPNT